MLEWFALSTWLALLVMLITLVFFYLRHQYNFLRHHQRVRWLMLTGFWMALCHLVLLGSNVWWDGLLVGFVLSTALFFVGELFHWGGNTWRQLTGRRIKK